MGTEAFSKGRAVTEAEGAQEATTHAEGSSAGRSSARGGSTADTVGTATADNWSEAYVTKYEELPDGQTWTLEEQIHLRSVSLARARVGEYHLQIQTARPVRVHPRFLGDIPILPSMVERVTEKLMAEAPQNRAAAVVDAEIEARQSRLAALAPAPLARRRGRHLSHNTPDVEDDDPNDEEGWRRLAEGKKP